MNYAWTIVRLALADIKHEWLMSLCLILAVTSIAAPLLLFFGLKTGTIETMRNRLLDNPVTLEILPNTEKVLDKTWFERWENDANVSFVVPQTRKLSAIAYLVPSGATKPRKLIDIRPTAFGDILLKHYAIPVPKLDECVLTAKTAEQLNLKAGDKVDFIVNRDQGLVQVSHTFTVVGVLPMQATALASAYIPSQQLVHIESFKDGRAVPEFGWAGTNSIVQPVLHRLLLLLQEPLDPIKKALMLGNTGFASLSLLENIYEDSHVTWHEPTLAYSIETRGNPAEYHNIEALKEKLRGLPYVLIPLSNTIRIRSVINTIADTPRDISANTISNASSNTISNAINTASFDLALAPATALDVPLPIFKLPTSLSLKQWSNFNEKPLLALLVHPSLLQIWQNSTDDQPLKPVNMLIEAIAHETDEKHSIQFEITLIPEKTVPKGVALAPQSLLGSLNMLSIRPLEVSISQDIESIFLLGRRGYSGFRMYASGLEQVAPLAAALEAEGIMAKTRADRIAEVQSFDKYLTMLFWIIASASSVGGIACLISSVYANVERKRREFAVLRLLGVHGLILAIFPLVSVSTLTIGGMTGALVLFHTVAKLINYLFAQHLAEGEFFCYLTLSQQAGAVTLALIMAIISGLLAALRLTSIEPAESLRAE